MQYKIRYSNANAYFLSWLKGVASIESLMEQFSLEFFDQLEAKTPQRDIANEILVILVIKLVEE